MPLEKPGVKQGSNSTYHFMVELQIPPMVPIPGVKLGLANIVTVFASFKLGSKDVACILFARILLGEMFSGQAMSIIYNWQADYFVWRQWFSCVSL